MSFSRMLHLFSMLVEEHSIVPAAVRDERRLTMAIGLQQSCLVQHFGQRRSSEFTCFGRGGRGLCDQDFACAWQ